MTPAMKSRQSYLVWLDNSRILAILAVVLVHVSVIPLTDSEVGSEYWWYGNIYSSMVRWAVPVFVMISGALLLDQNKREDLAVFYQKRISRILWPILFWSPFYLLLGFRKNLLLGDLPSFAELAKILLSGQANNHMWFMYMILGLYVFTPFFRMIIANSTDKELIIFVVVTFIIAAGYSAYRSFYPDSGPGLFVISFISYIPYYFMGHLLRHSAIKPSKTVLYAICGLSFIATAIGCYFVSTWHDLRTGLYFYNYLSVTVIPMSISIMFIFKTWTNPVFSKIHTEKIASLTLGIYLIHQIPIVIFNSKHIGLLSYNPALAVPVTTFLVCITSLAGALIISKLPYLKRTI